MATQQQALVQQIPPQKKPQGVLGFACITAICSYCCARQMGVSSPYRTTLISLASTTGVTILGSLTTLESAHRWKWSTETLRWVMGGLTATTHLCSLIALLGPSVLLKCHLLLTFACVSGGRVVYELFALRPDPPRPPLPPAATLYAFTGPSTPYDALAGPFYDAMQKARKDLADLAAKPTAAPSFRVFTSEEMGLAFSCQALYYATIKLACYYLFKNPSVALNKELNEINPGAVDIKLKEPRFIEHIKILNENIPKLTDAQAIRLLTLQLTEESDDKIKAVIEQMEESIKIENLEIISAVFRSIGSLTEPLFSARIVTKYSIFKIFFAAEN